MSDLSDLKRFLAQLPLFSGDTVSLEKTGEGRTESFEVRSAGRKAVLKVYGEEAEASPLVRARYRAKAEAEGLNLFGPRSLAPELLAQGTIDGKPVVLMSFLQREEAAAEQGPEQEADLLLSTLKEIHGVSLTVKLVSSTPRNLEEWLARAYEGYRDLPASAEDNVPRSALEALHTLVHPISADAQAHRRYWQAAPLTPVHGSPDRDNLRIKGGRLALVDWERFGMGDPALEVATWAGLLSFEDGPEAEKSFTGRYLVGNEDELLPPRIEIYSRVWPFGYLLPLLARAMEVSGGGASSLPRRKAVTLVRCFVRLMRAYERPPDEIEQVQSDLRGWLGLPHGASPAQE